MRREHAISAVGRWISRWGFAALVVLAAAAGVTVATTVAIPVAVPGVALQAEAVYRLEVGAAVFVGLYLGVLVVVLALHNRGFTEIGTAGIRAQDLDAMSEAVLAQEDSVRLLSAILERMRDPHEAGDGNEHE